MLDLGMSLEVLRPVLTAAARTGARVTTSILEGSSDRVTIAAAADLVRTLERESGARHLALEAAAELREGDLGLFDLLVGTAGTLREAAALSSRAFRLLHDSAKLELREHGALASFCLIPTPGHAAIPVLIEFTLISIAKMARRLAGRDLRATRVLFTHAAPPHAYELEGFFGAPVTFGADHVAIEFPAIYLDLPLPGANASRRSALLAAVERLLETQPSNVTLVTMVRRSIAGGMERGEHHLREVADQLGIDIRTLQRRLRALGTSYGEILDSVRKEHALAAAEGRLRMGEIARRVGLPDRAAFRRAFVRWTGTTPRDYRRKRR